MDQDTTVQTTLEPPDGKASFCSRLREDATCRRRFILTVSTWMTYIALGWIVLQIGAALPDLQIIAGVDLANVSWIFTVWALGTVVGSPIVGFLLDRFNRMIIMATTSAGAAVCSFILPYSTSFPVMVAVRFATGVFTGAMDTGVNTIVPTIWGAECTPFMQALYLFYTVGGIFSPLVTEIFMIPKEYRHRKVAVAVANITSTPSITRNSNTESSVYNLASNISGSLNASAIFVPSSSSEATTSGIVIVPESHIHSAFLITGCITLITSVPYLLMAIKGGFDVKSHNAKPDCAKDTTDESEKDMINKAENDLDEKEVAELDDQEHTQLNVHEKSEDTCLRRQKSNGSSASSGSQRLVGFRLYFVVVCVAGSSLLYSGVEDSLGDFLVTFCLDYLDWNNSASITITTLYWATSCLGAIGGVFLIRVLSPAQLLFIAFIVWCVSFISLVVGSLLLIDTMVWVSLSVSGVAMVIVVPTLIGWLETNVCQVSGIVASFMTVGAFIGIAANPNFIGYMMEAYSYIYFVYILLCEAILSGVCFFLGYMGHMYGRSERCQQLLQKSRPSKHVCHV